MRKIIGIGETVFDIIFENNQPTSGRPGGSVYNALISLGRMKYEPIFISEIGDDRIGKIIMNFLEENHVDTKYIYSFSGKTALALAFLNEKQNADYLFYKDYPAERLDYIMPRIDEDDIVVIGSFFALNPVLHDKVVELLEFARDRKAIIYYDVNFRKTHVPEVRFLMPSILDNFEFADIIKGSDEDFVNIFNDQDPDLNYKEHVEFYTKNFLYTRGDKGAIAYSKGFRKEYKANPINPVSTVGAGDNFNAGIIYGLLKYDVKRKDLVNGTVPEETWDKIVKCAVDFSSYVCTTYENYISNEFAENYLKNE
ncbi:MAG TPA: carbohydrate kinase [Paludibacteraceae bacterium]|nr:carbohydrate kinase [Paludibacteraceae bacterium]HPH64019.1 carbohydrate kinase [Paludibacteraceae bacterium]